VDVPRACMLSGAEVCKAAPRFQVQGAEFRSRARRRASGIGTGPTLERAGEMAQGICQNDQPGACTVIHENCTEQIFKKY